MRCLRIRLTIALCFWTVRPISTSTWPFSKEIRYGMKTAPKETHIWRDTKLGNVKKKTLGQKLKVKLTSKDGVVTPSYVQTYLRMKLLKSLEIAPLKTQSELNLPFSVATTRSSVSLVDHPANQTRWSTTSSLISASSSGVFSRTLTFRIYMRNQLSKLISYTSKLCSIQAPKSQRLWKFSSIPTKYTNSPAIH